MLAQIRKSNTPLPNLIVEKEVNNTSELDNFLLKHEVLIPVSQLAKDLKYDQVSYFIYKE